MQGAEGEQEEGLFYWDCLHSDYRSKKKLLQVELNDRSIGRPTENHSSTIFIIDHCSFFLSGNAKHSVIKASQL